MKLDRIDRGRFGGLRRQGSRVALQEYVPFAAWIFAWAAIAGAVGLSTAMKLMAANGFLQAVRSLFLMQSFDAISARTAHDPDSRAAARRLVIGIDLAVLLGSVALLLPMAAAMMGLGLTDVATMIWIMALGLPARTPAVLALDRRNIGTAWRLGSAIALVAGAGLVLLFNLDWMWAALSLALREWGGLVSAWLARRPAQSTVSQPLPKLGFPEVALRTSFAARRRLVYRIGKIPLSLLGPVGTLLARTGRGGGVDAHLAQKVSVNPIVIGVIAAASSAAAVATLMLNRDPAALVVAAVIARLAAASLSVLIWWRWNGISTDFEWLNEDL